MDYNLVSILGMYQVHLHIAVAEIKVGILPHMFNAKLDIMQDLLETVTLIDLAVVGVVFIAVAAV
jgi:hypothetical protein